MKEKNHAQGIQQNVESYQQASFTVQKTVLMDKRQIWSYLEKIYSFTLGACSLIHLSGHIAWEDTQLS